MQAVLEKAVDFITDAKMTVTPTPRDPAPEVLMQKYWNYFPHFTRAGVKELMPWEVFAQQVRTGQSELCQYILQAIRYRLSRPSLLDECGDTILFSLR